MLATGERNIYSRLTGQSAYVGQEEGFERPANYLEGIEKALMGELKAFERYRTIYLNIRPEFRDMIFEIMTDEIKHPSYYNWLYEKQVKMRLPKIGSQFHKCTLSSPNSKSTLLVAL